jgi:Tfp pilus assembly protein PilW
MSLWQSRTKNEQGFTLVEFLVANIVFLALLVAVGTVVAGAKKGSDDVQNINRLNEEARTAINRISRELRQAKDITGVIGANGAPGGDGSHGFTFEVDLNGDGVITPNSDTDPEVITYSYDPTNQLIQLSAADSSGAVQHYPVLSGKVTAFTASYHSSNYHYDCNGDGVTDWTEIDSGTCRPTPLSGAVAGQLDQNELRYIDSVVLQFTVANTVSGRTRSQVYRTQIDLRNADHTIS